MHLPFLKLEPSFQVIPISSLYFLILLLLILLLQETFASIIDKLSEAGSWHLLLEYELPRRQKRPDAIIFANDIVIVIEFKFEAEHYDSSSQWQAREYMMDLRDFHEESRDRIIIPILCATHAPERDCSLVQLKSGTEALRYANKNNLVRVILECYNSGHNAPR